MRLRHGESHARSAITRYSKAACPLCLRAGFKMTNEHIVPKWASRVLRERRGRPAGRFVTHKESTNVPDPFECTSGLVLIATVAYAIAATLQRRALKRGLARGSTSWACWRPAWRSFPSRLDSRQNSPARPRPKRCGWRT
jgi:hypothetical protein